VKIDEQAETFVRETEISQQLLFVNRRQILDGFHFDDYLVPDDQIRSEAGIDADVFINDRDRLPAHHAEAPGRKERKGHKPDETLKPSGKIETACYKADRAIQQVLDQLAA
jgi:hypothetical protein